MDMGLVVELLNHVIDTWYRTGNIGLFEVSFLELSVGILRAKKVTEKVTITNEL